ncbi:peptidoglycan-binding protein [Muricauda oceani]|uniref:Peptidoglycan-binding protein n=1 Tax=Flagellimonas oceani TaxID=2698672 RepID=A0A6G7J767_9FLAO|nr:peptidoglycan-binding domain-containing protein [Allomuricauda oceani]MBW8242522.1 peptidoglycan-binding protein [Allomuricauda oceani]QII46282.1 peptidoglycan-binding protein [Allomuricauda oceani]
MAVFISKKALAKIPNQFQSTYIPVGRKVLIHNSLKENRFFNNLVKQSQGAKELKKDDVGPNVELFQAILKAVRSFQEGQLVETEISGSFGIITETTLKDAQSNFDLPETGVLDAQTLLAIDSFLVENQLVFNKKSGIVLADGSEGEIKLTITTVDGKVYANIEQTVLLEPTISQTDGVPDFSQKENGAEIVSARPTLDGKHYFVGDGKVENPILSENKGYFIEKGLVPRTPSGLPPDAKPRTIREGETLISIIHEEYLKDAYPIYTVPGEDTSAVLHEFPARTLSQDDKDYRIRFYANLIYYMNTDPSIAYAIHRSSISPNTIDYTDTHLDEVNIYDNDTFGLNYKNFLERIENLDPNYEWNLYASNYTVPYTGETYTFDAPFNLDVGEDLYLPSREFVEALYLHLNFRPKEGEMYEKKTDSEGNNYFDWIPQTGFDDFLDDVANAISDAAERTLTINLYTEAYTFFKNVYSWIIDVLNDHWPRSMGFQVNLDAEVAALFGIGVGGSAYVWRKVTPKDEITIQTITSAEVRGTVGGGVGFDFNLGGSKKGKMANMGSKKASKKGLAAYAGVDAKVGLGIYQEHEFPVNKENTALLALLLPAINATSSVANGLSKILNYLEVINIDPMDYITKLVVEIETKGRGFGRLNLGLNITNESDYAKNASGTYEVDANNQDSLSVNGIAKLFKKVNFFYGGGVDIGYGYAWETNWTYGNLPDMPKYDGRMANKVSSQIEIFYEGSAALDASVSNFIQRLVLGAIGGVPVLPTFNFDAGIALVAGLELKREDIPENHAFADYNLSLADLGDPNNNTSKFLGAKLYSGDFEVPVTPASEIIANINIGQLKQIIDGQSGNTNILSFTNLLLVFDKLGYRKRFSANLESYQSKQNNTVLNRVRNFTDSYRSQTYVLEDNGEDINYGSKDFFKTLERTGFTFSSSIEIDTEFSMDATIKALQYVCLRLRFMASREKYENANQLSVYVSKLQQINEAYQEVLTPASGNFTENDFDFLLNDATWGLQTILDIGGTGENELVPYNAILGEMFRFLDTGELRDLLQDTNRENLINESTRKAQELLGLLKDAFQLWVKQANTTLKLNSKLSVNTGLNLKGAFGPKVSLAAFFEFGFFDEFLVVDQGELVLEGETTDNPLYETVQAIAKQFSKDTTVPDFDSGNELGGKISQTLLNESI